MEPGEGDDVTPAGRWVYPLIDARALAAARELLRARDLDGMLPLDDRAGNRKRPQQILAGRRLCR